MHEISLWLRLSTDRRGQRGSHPTSRRPLQYCCARHTSKLKRWLGVGLASPLGWPRRPGSCRAMHRWGREVERSLDGQRRRQRRRLAHEAKAEPRPTHGASQERGNTLLMENVPAALCPLHGGELILEARHWRLVRMQEAVEADRAAPLLLQRLPSRALLWRARAQRCHGPYRRQVSRSIHAISTIRLDEGVRCSGIV